MPLCFIAPAFWQLFAGFCFDVGFGWGIFFTFSNFIRVHYVIRGIHNWADK